MDCESRLPRPVSKRPPVAMETRPHRRSSSISSIGQSISSSLSKFPSNVSKIPAKLSKIPRKFSGFMPKNRKERGGTLRSVDSAVSFGFHIKHPIGRPSLEDDVDSLSNHLVDNDSAYQTSFAGDNVAAQQSHLVDNVNTYQISPPVASDRARPHSAPLVIHKVGTHMEAASAFSEKGNFNFTRGTATKSTVDASAESTSVIDEEDRFNLPYNNSTQSAAYASIEPTTTIAEKDKQNILKPAAKLKKKAPVIAEHVNAHWGNRRDSYEWERINDGITGEFQLRPKKTGTLKKLWGSIKHRTDKSESTDRFELATNNTGNLSSVTKVTLETPVLPHLDASFDFTSDAEETLTKVSQEISASHFEPTSETSEKKNKHIIPITRVVYGSPVKCTQSPERPTFLTRNHFKPTPAVDKNAKPVTVVERKDNYTVPVPATYSFDPPSVIDEKDGRNLRKTEFLTRYHSKPTSVIRRNVKPPSTPEKKDKTSFPKPVIHAIFESPSVIDERYNYTISNSEFSTRKNFKPPSIFDKKYNSTVSKPATYASVKPASTVQKNDNHNVPKSTKDLSIKPKSAFLESDNQATPIPVLQLHIKPPLTLDEKDKIFNSRLPLRTHSHDEKLAVREARRRYRTSEDFLGIQGANPRTGLFDPSAATSSTEVTKAHSDRSSNTDDTVIHRPQPPPLPDPVVSNLEEPFLDSEIACAVPSLPSSPRSSPSYMSITPTTIITIGTCAIVVAMMLTRGGGGGKGGGGGGIGGAFFRGLAPGALNVLGARHCGWI